MLAGLKTCLLIVQERVVGSGERVALEKSQVTTILWTYFSVPQICHLPALLKIKFRLNILKIIKQNYRSPCNLKRLDVKTWVNLITIASSLCLKFLYTSSVPLKCSFKD